MRKKKIGSDITAAVLAVLCLLAGPGQAQVAADKAAPKAAADEVAALYGLVGSPGGALPDWDKVRSCFLKEAVIVLRTSRTSMKAFTLEGFIQDFIDFYERPYKMGEATFVPKESGFTEKVIKTKAWEYGDMAHVLVLYEAMITGSPMKPQRGVDSWLLIRRDGRWLIAGATNEIVTAANPVPPELR